MRKAVRFTDFIQAHVEKTDPHRIFIDKETTRRIATEVGTDIPECYQHVATADQIDFRNLPEAFVVKPTHLSSKKGVYVLFRVRDKFVDLMSRRIVSEDDIKRELDIVIGNQLSNILVEELITGENGTVSIPYDYKLYTFDSGVELIIQINRNAVPNEICIMGADFQPLGKELAIVNTTYGRQGEALVPSNRDYLISVSRNILTHIDRPFMSIDLFTTGNRVILGELTPAPGGPYFDGLFFFSPALDHHLGACQAAGYQKRGWDIPLVERFPPSRVRDKLFPPA